jgi:serine/threonine-protein kinase
VSERAKGRAGLAHLGSATDAEQVALLRSRVVAFATFSGGTSLLFVLANQAVSVPLLGVEDALAAMARPGGVLQLAVGTLVFLLGAVAQRAPDAALFAVDAAVAFITCAGFNSVFLSSPLRDRPELIVTIIAGFTLMGRAAFVPSSGRRTFMIGLVALAPLVATTYAAYAAAAGGTPPWFVAIYTLQWTTVALLLSTLTSRIIYGLQRRVDEARRLGQYTLDAKIGEGGMGEVYRASHAFLRRPTAVKLLPASRSDARDVARFEREVQLTSRLTHPNTIQIYDFGRADDGTFYYAMEYLDGITLEELVVRDGAQPAARVARILAEVCASLIEAHALALVHRDIKPQNVMLCARGGLFDVVKVLDFGLVKSFERPADDGVAATGTHAVAGTPSYMAPESIVAPDTVDARSDLYAVGALGYYLLVGAEVFSGRSAFEILGQQLHAVPIAPSDRAGRALPPELEALILACLAKSPKERPASARVLHDALRGAEAKAGLRPESDAVAWWERFRAQQPPPIVLAATEPQARRLTATKHFDVHGAS